MSNLQETLRLWRLAVHRWTIERRRPRKVGRGKKLFEVDCLSCLEAAPRALIVRATPRPRTHPDISTMQLIIQRITDIQSTWKLCLFCSADNRSRDSRGSRLSSELHEILYCRLSDIFVRLLVNRDRGEKRATSL